MEATENSHILNRHIFCNGKFYPADQPVLSVKDRGFRFGDGVFETIRVYEGVPYQWDLHIHRLIDGLEQLHINADLSNLVDASKELLVKNNKRNCFLRIAVSRGCGSAGYMPTYETDPTVVIETMDIPSEKNESADLWVSKLRHIPAECIPAGIKTMQGLNYSLAQMYAEEHGCTEALMLGIQGQLSECSSSNLFWLKHDTLYTPSLACDIVRGTMRDAVIRLSPYKVVEDVFHIKELEDAESVFITSVKWLAFPVRSIQPIGKALTNFNAAMQFRELILDDIKTHAP